MGTRSVREVVPHRAGHEEPSSSARQRAGSRASARHGLLLRPGGKSSLWTRSARNQAAPSAPMTAFSREWTSLLECAKQKVGSPVCGSIREAICRVCLGRLPPCSRLRAPVRRKCQSPSRSSPLTQTGVMRGIQELGSQLPFHSHRRRCMKTQLPPTPRVASRSRQKPGNHVCASHARRSR